MQDVVQMSQVHGNNVAIATSGDLGTKILDCDGLITNNPKVTLSIRVADCLPIFIYDPKSGARGLVHAGWRGLEKEIIKMAIQKMKDKWKIEPEKLNVYIGPHICQKHYEVGPELIEKFKKYRSAIKKTKGKAFIDLATVAKTQLINLGVNAKNIKIDKTCTLENKKLFSYRRNKSKGRNVYFFSGKL